MKIPVKQFCTEQKKKKLKICGNYVKRPKLTWKITDDEHGGVCIITRALKQTDNPLHISTLFNAGKPIEVLENLYLAVN